MDRQNTVICFVLIVVIFVLIDDQVSAMTASEKNNLKLKVLEMFDHAYGSYMQHAYPADELMPLSCKGRHKGSEPSRGDIDDTLGNFTLTLIDSLDTLAVLGKIPEFEEAVRLVIRDSRFDCDTIVSVFETNIRVLGGLLGGHVVASYLKRKGKGLLWYNSELLEKAREVGDRLLPAFNTSTGIPYPRINLKKGIAQSIFAQSRDTCTACAGTMLLEFGALSRMTGDPKYEEKARKAMDYLWQQRHRTSDLMGLVINIHNGDWTRRESGIGAGFDSYYEYVFKSYILLGDETYLDRFNKHYDAVMRYVSQGPMFIDVHMHKPNAASRNFMDALLAFWPGLQVLKGDIRPAIETHEMFYQMIQRHNFLPEAFTTDFRIHWSHHPLRPEFLESTYFLYKATGDDHYLEVGQHVLENLNKHARVSCGFAALKDVTTNRHEDQMDSYVLAETFKYLFLLFAENEDLVLDIDDYIFTTEAHLLPLSLSVHNTTQLPKIQKEVYQSLDEVSYSTEQTSDPGEQSIVGNDEDDYNTCPNIHVQMPPGSKSAESLRSQMRNLVDRVSPRPRRDGNRMRKRLAAGDFIAGNKDHLEILHLMGIRIATMADGRIQLLHTASEAATPEDAEDGMKFMQEMIELSKTQSPEAQHDPMFVHLISPRLFIQISHRAGPAQFGYDLKIMPPVRGKLAISSPFKACSTITNPQTIEGKIALLERGECMFVDKARNLQKAGAIAGIVLDQNEGSTSETQTLFAMSGDGQTDITIPLVFLFKKEGNDVIKALTEDNDLEVVMSKESTLVEVYHPTSALNPPAGPETTQVTSPSPTEAPDTLPDQTPPPYHDPLNGPDDGDRIGLDETYSYESSSKKVRMEIKVTGEMDSSVFNEVSDREQSGSHKNKPITKSVKDDNNVLQLDILPDGSKQLSFQLEKNKRDTQTQPELAQIYVDLVQALQKNTNFEKLTNQGDYLVAIARILESVYFGLDRVDSEAQTRIENLAQELKFLKDKSASRSEGVKESAPGVTEDHFDFERAKQLHYASAEELYETGGKVQGNENKFVETKSVDDSVEGFGARVNKDGVLVFPVEQETSNSDNINSETSSQTSQRSGDDYGTTLETIKENGYIRVIEKNSKGEIIDSIVRSIEESNSNSDSGNIDTNNIGHTQRDSVSDNLGNSMVENEADSIEIFSEDGFITTIEKNAKGEEINRLTVKQEEDHSNTQTTYSGKQDKVLHKTDKKLNDEL